MIGKLAGHSMFAGAGALDRLQMCGDCRVVDLIDREERGHPQAMSRRAARRDRAREARQLLAPRKTRARAEFYALLAGSIPPPPDAPLLSALGASEPWPDDGTNPASRCMEWPGAGQPGDGRRRRGAGVHRPLRRRGQGRVQPARVLLDADAALRPLVAVRAELARLGLGRRGSAVYEDHLGALCESMRIARSQARRDARAPIAVQKAVFRHVSSEWVDRCCDCNNAMSGCQLLPSSSRIHWFLPGGRP